MSKQIPHVSHELLSWLESRFPDRIPDRLLELRELDAKLGEQRVIRLLRKTLQEQQENLLESLQD